MRALIVEDDFTSRLILQKILQPYGEVHLAVNGKEALEAFCLAHQNKEPYDLMCLDILMPEMDGQTVLKEIRRIEAETGIHGYDGVKIIMISALNDRKNILSAFKSQCEAYLVKPVDRERLEEHLRAFKLIE